MEFFPFSTVFFHVVTATVIVEVFFFSFLSVFFSVSVRDMCPPSSHAHVRSHSDSVYALRFSLIELNNIII